MKVETHPVGGSGHGRGSGGWCGLSDEESGDGVQSTKPRRLAPIAQAEATGWSQHLPHASTRAPIGTFRCRSLLTRVEVATGERSPASALITFARHLSGQCDTSLAYSRRCLSTSSTHGCMSRPGTSPTHSHGPVHCQKPATPRSAAPRQPCTLVARRRWEVLQPRWRTADLRAGNSPSVRAYAAVETQSIEPDPAASGSFDVFDEAEFNLAADVNISQPVLQAATAACRVSGSLCEDEVHEERIDLPWKEHELRSVFKKFSDFEDKEVRTDCLVSLLRYLGAVPVEEEVWNIICDQTRYASLDWVEFMEFIRRYRRQELARLRALFDKADVDGSGGLDFSEIHTLLQKSGYSPTVEVSLEALQATDEDGNGLVTFPEFEALLEHLRLCRGFTKAEAEELQALYIRAAGGANKMLSIGELWRISAYIGYAATPEKVQSIVSEIDKDGSHEVCFDELLNVVRGIRDSERQEMLRIVDRRGIEVGTKLGIGIEAHPDVDAGSPQPVTQLTRSQAPGRKRGAVCIARDDTITLTPEQRMRVAARKTVRLPLKLPIEEVAPTLNELGYYVSEDVIAPLLEGMQMELENPAYVTVDELSAFLVEYRRAEGFSEAALKDLEYIFLREQRQSAAGDDDNSLDALELGRVLRWFGISKSLQQVQRLIEEIDFDGSGQVEFGEFKKLMRQLLQAEAKHRRDIFAHLEDEGTGRMPVEKLSTALSLIMGVRPDESMVQAAIADAGVDCISSSSLLSQDWRNPKASLSQMSFEAIFASYKTRLVDTVRANAGYVPAEVEKLRALFARYDKGEGIVYGAELRRVIADTFSEATRTKEGQQDMQKRIAEIAPEKPCRINFSQFLRLARMCQDRRDEEDIEQEVEALKECHFRQDEVEGYRQLFSANSSWAGELTMEALRSLLSPVHNFSFVEDEELSIAVRNISTDGREATRFPQFLRLMWMLMRDNFLGLNDAAERALKRAETQEVGVGNLRQSIAYT
eukprot:TRINITY_DN10332_c0_g2_i1.p1 TRINITY_DN10332_c0_g2~~TRINITY_DN10332_c0_g2_i1.p1  ORF type:complete len:986 (+),score=211.17 TRINITY_DN10332_c0_g2_i1:104-3061(+)